MSNHAKQLRKIAEGGQLICMTSGTIDLIELADHIDKIEQQLVTLSNPENDPITLWTEIYKLREEVKGPRGYDTWKEAAVDERVKRTKLERQNKELRKNQYPIYILIAEAAYKEGCGKDKSIASDKLKSIVDSVFEKERNYAP